MHFLQEVQAQYDIIKKSCAPNISRHFTDITAVINEGNSYEFPSPELHKAIINKLILNDQQHFKQFFLFIKKSYKENQEVIQQQYPEFQKQMEAFLQHVDQDIHNKLINIDQYMKDLKKHANNEYNELYFKEHEIFNNKQKNKKKKKKAKNKKGGQNTEGQQEQQQQQKKGQ